MQRHCTHEGVMGGKITRRGLVQSAGMLGGLEGWVLWPEAPPGLAAKHLPKQQARQCSQKLNQTP